MGGLYNLIHGMNSVLAVIASPFLPRTADAFPRFRDIFTSTDDAVVKGDLYIFTRMGGGNSECWSPEKEPCDCPACDAFALTKDAGCIGRYNDGFDNTYCTFIWKVAEEHRADWQHVMACEFAQTSDWYKSRLREMFKGRDKILDVIEECLKMTGRPVPAKEETNVKS